MKITLLSIIFFVLITSCHAQDKSKLFCDTCVKPEKLIGHKNPTFSGGIDSIQSYLSMNIPDTIKGKCAKVVLTFRVDTLGGIKNILIGFPENCESDCILLKKNIENLLINMNGWTPSTYTNPQTGIVYKQEWPVRLTINLSEK
jgi:hypothetical protein